MQELTHTIGRIVARPGRGPLLEAALGDIAREARLEPGNLQFNLYRDTSDDHAFVVEERWVDGASMQNHRTTPQARRLAGGRLLSAIAGRTTQQRRPYRLAHRSATIIRPPGFGRA